MSKPRYKWWGYVKWVIRDYPAKCEEMKAMRVMAVTPSYSPQGHGSEASRTTELVALRGFTGQKEREYEAVRQAAEETANYRDGTFRMKFIELLFWKKTHTLEGAAMACNVCSATARAWHREFIRLVAANLGLMDE